MAADLSLFPNKLFPPALPPKRFVGGGPAGVVVGLKGKPDGAGVVEPRGADELLPPVEALPKKPFPSPGPGRGREPALREGFGGVCEPPRPAKDGGLEAVLKPPNPVPDLLSAVAPFEALFSPVLASPNPAKLKPLPADLPASPAPKRLLPVVCGVLPPPNRLLPAGLEVPKRLEPGDCVVEGVPPKLSL